MTPLCPHEPRTSRWRSGFLWTSAAIVVLTAHVSSAAWLVSQTPPESDASGPPPAIMIDLAPEPEAINTDTTEISDQTEDAPDMAALTPPVEEEQPLPPPVEEAVQPPPEPLPVPEAAEPPPEPVKPVEQAAVPLPIVQPPPEKPLSEKAKEKPKPKKPVEKVEKQKERPKAQPAPSRPSVAAAAETNQGARNAAQKASAGTGASSVAPARWQSKVQAHLAKRKSRLARSRNRDELGTVLVRFNIDTSGNVLSVSLARSSGFPSLDQDVLALVRAASPVPAPPPDVNRTLTVPFEFTSR